MNMQLSLKEKEILVTLLDKPKSIEELQGKMFFGFNETREIVRELLKKKRIKKEETFPTTYSVKKELRKEVRELKRRIDWTELISDACFVCNQ
jgi:predicted transcriptional regulator